MISEKMIAPCGLDCSLCSYAQLEHDPCPGCNGDSENKPAFCAEWCDIIKCVRRRENGYEYCDECPVYPCAHIQERENRYMNDYPLKESPMKNLQTIRRQGMEAFQRQEREEWTCKSCGGTFSVHTGRCGKCGSSR